MKWNECARLFEEMDLQSRFDWPGVGGFDCQADTFTINDIWGAISWVWTWPGDYLLSLQEVQTFFDFEAKGEVIGSGWSTLIGWVIFWLVFLAIIGALISVE